MTKWRLFIGGVGLRLMFLTPRDGMGNHQSPWQLESSFLLALS